MKTDIIFVSNTGDGWDDVFSETEKYAQYKQLNNKEKIHIRLLAEELLSMVKSIAGQFHANVWIDDDQYAYYIHLKALVNMDGDIRSTFIDASTSGKNAAAKGIMGKLKDIFQTYMAGMKFSGSAPLTDYYGGFSGYDPYEMEAFNSYNMWSLSNYRQSIQGEKDDSDTQKWDELEKSIIANIADEITVGINGDYVEMVITKENR